MMLRVLLTVVMLIFGATVIAHSDMWEDLFDNVTTGSIERVMVDDDGYGIYRLRGVRVEQTLAAGYYLTEGGGLKFEEGRWLLLAVGIGGDETRTGWGSDDVLIEADPDSCLESLGGNYASGAFSVLCDATVGWSVKSPYPSVFLIFMPLSD